MTALAAPLPPPRPPVGPVACKIGTVPATVVFDKRCSFTVGRRVRLRNAGPGHKWFWAILTNIDPLRLSR
jgi:hypothetical protein